MAHRPETPDCPAVVLLPALPLPRYEPKLRRPASQLLESSRQTTSIRWSVELLLNVPRGTACQSRFTRYPLLLPLQPAGAFGRPMAVNIQFAAMNLIPTWRFSKCLFWLCGHLLIRNVTPRPRPSGLCRRDR